MMADNGRVEIDSILQLLDQAYSRRSWHGATLRGSLRGVSSETAARRPRLGRHNIWEIAVHGAYWKYVVRRRITGEPRGSFPLAGSNWFTRPEGVLRADDWRRDLVLLDESHRHLRQAVDSLRDRDLWRSRVSGAHAGLRRLLHGIAFHDIYHAGQIQLIKRLVSGTESD